MDLSTKNFATVDTAQSIARNLYSEAKNIAMVSHGSENIVALVDEKHAVRFPQDQSAYARSLYERHILKQMEGTRTLDIPRLSKVHDDPPYMITSYVSGHHRSSEEVRIFSTKDQQDFAKRLANFTYAMHQTLNLVDELKVREELGLNRGKPWARPFRENMMEVTFSDPQQDAIVKKCYADWVRLCNVEPTVVVHDDLLSQNMMFDGNNKLAGIIDFGDVNVGTPEQEFQQLYRVNEDLARVAANEYKRVSGKTLDMEVTRSWSIMKELSDYSRRLQTKRTDHPKFRAACNYLATWFPEVTWTNRAVQQVSSQRGDLT